jgi:serine/threonine protein kinase
MNKSTPLKSLDARARAHAHTTTAAAATATASIRQLTCPLTATAYAPSTLKVGDFGRAVLIGYIPPPDEPAPLRWSAPEVVSGQTYSEASEVWSFGVTMWEIANGGRVPFARQDDAQVRHTILLSGSTGVLLPRPDECPDDLFRLMESCWLPKATSRPTFAELVSRLPNQDAVIGSSPSLSRRSLSALDDGHHVVTSRRSNSYHAPTPSAPLPSASSPAIQRHNSQGGGARRTHVLHADPLVDDPPPPPAGGPMHVSASDFFLFRSDPLVSDPPAPPMVPPTRSSSLPKSDPLGAVAAAAAAKGGNRRASSGIGARVPTPPPFGDDNTDIISEGMEPPPYSPPRDPSLAAVSAASAATLQHDARRRENVAPLERLLEMGFDEEKARRALQDAGSDVALATSILLST